MKTLRTWAAGMCVWLLSLSACLPATPVAPTAIADPRSAVVSEFSGVVKGRTTAAEVLVPVSVGFTLKPSGEVQTGEASRARLDLSDGALVRLGALTAFVLEDLMPLGSENVFVRLQMAFGKIWVSLTGGELQVETPVGVASVRGSFAIIRYLPNDPNIIDDDVLVLDCLEGSCRAVSPIVNVQLGNLERIVIGSQTTLRQPLTQVDVQNFIQENPESVRLAATLTAAPPATDTSTPTLSPYVNPTATATETLTPTTPTPPPTATTIPTPSVSIIGVHRVQPGETIYCIARAYGVLPDAIIQVNDLRTPISLSVNQALNIPAVRWPTISAGPVCPPQFRSPYPELPLPSVTPTLMATPLHTATPTLVPALTSTAAPSPTATAMTTSTFTPTPTHTFTPTPTHTFTPTPTPTPDNQGPTITNLQATPNPIDPNVNCQVTLTAEISDPAGVSSALVNWIFTNPNNDTNSGSLSMTLVSGNLWQVVWENIAFTVYPRYGTITWSIMASDGLGNTAMSSVSSLTVITPGCPAT